MTNNLWGTLPVDAAPTPPVAILREQASILGDMTDRVLEGEVKTRRDGDELTLTLEIVAPALDGYRYTVVTAQHSVEMYPARLFSQVIGTWQSCESPVQFEARLGKILSSEAIKKIIAALLAQSKSGW
ncbi:MAG: hypothetical protein M3081_02885 [Gemmatimonadota bacterium]|nr:hypothetical protein [Gemmatimonadota bacterium]